MADRVLLAGYPRYMSLEHITEGVIAHTVTPVITLYKLCSPRGFIYFVNMSQEWPSRFTRDPLNGYCLQIMAWGERLMVRYSSVAVICENRIYTKISNISRTKSQNLNDCRLVLHLFCPIYWSRVLSREWRCSWSCADRRCFNYIWVINNLIAYTGTSYISDLTAQ